MCHHFFHHLLVSLSSSASHSEYHIFFKIALELKVAMLESQMLVKVVQINRYA